MPRLNWNQRFFESTRGKIIMLLRRASRTVEELAQALNLTDNAVRTHLVILERDGLVRQQGVRHGAGKPTFVYELAPETEQLFPKAYGSVLREFLQVLKERLPPNEVETVLRIVGRRIAGQRTIPSGDLRTRLEAAVNVLDELGGMAELELCEGSYAIHGYSCPLAAAVPGHPEVCHLAETLLTELVGVPVHEQCEYGETPHCCFVVPVT
jgi:predicted ArsR family transcriptional regulator